MRALRLEGQGIVSVIDAPDPVPGPDEALIETAVSALCGSELHTYRGPGEAEGNTGHEAAGTVVQVGPGVTQLTVGQRVGLSAVVGCGHCDQCASGRYTWCESVGVHSSMHAEQIAIPSRGCHPLPDDVPWDVGVLITGDALGVPYHTSTRLTDPGIECVSIFGVGPIGLGNALLQAHLGRRVIAVDAVPDRLELAAVLGASYIIHAAKSDPVAVIRELTLGRGADVCIEAAGRPETLRQCFAAVRTGGTVVMNGEQPAVQLSPSVDFIRRDITAMGSWFYHFGEYPEMLALWRGGLPIERLITHRYAPDQANVAYAESAAGRTGKVLLLWNR